MLECDDEGAQNKLETRMGHQEAGRATVLFAAVVHKMTYDSTDAMELILRDRQ